MRKKLIGIIILLIALSFLVYGIIFAQYTLINPLYNQMAAIP
ncbi:MAG: hypothetical protein ACQERB_14485 [Promethearchaeati archaeon]